MNNLFVNLWVVIVLLSTSFSWGNEHYDYGKPDKKFSVGTVFISSSSIYKKDNVMSAIVPFLSYQSESVRLNLQEGLSYTVRDTSKYSFGLSFRPNFQPYKSSDSSELAGVKRETTFDGVGFVSYKIARGLRAEIEISTEFSNKFDGHSLDIAFSQFIPILGSPFIFTGGLDWNDKNRAQYFYGLYDQEITPQRAAYSPGPVFLPYLAISTFYNLNEDAGIFSSINATILPKNVLISPIVSKNASISFIIGISHNF